jgi:hypothetical protein
MKCKILLFSILSLFLANFIKAQSPALWAFYHNTPRTETSLKFTVPGLAVKFGSLFIAEKEVRKVVRKIGKVRLFVVEEQQDFITRKETNRFIKRLHRDGFEDFITVRENDTNVSFMVRERRNKIKGIVMLVKDEGDFVLISAKCNLKAKDLMGFINEHSDELISEAKKKKRNSKNT